MSTKEDLLHSLTVKELRALAKKYRVSLVQEGWFSDGYATTKDDIVEILLESPRITKKKILEIIEETTEPTQKKKEIREKKVKVERKPVKVKGITFDSILDEIRAFKRRIPKFTGRQRERLYTTALTSFLSHTFPSIEMEQSLGEGSRIDALIGKIGIEAKYRPDQNEINRLYGQIDTYLRFLDSIIVVFFDSSSGVINNFKEKLRRGGYTEEVEVVNI